MPRPTQPRPVPDVIVAGELGVDLHAASAGPLADAESFDRRFGGAAANVAVGLARLGVPTGLWARVGDDAFGDFLVDRAAAAGVDAGFVERDPAAPTGLVVVGRDGDREFQHYLHAAASRRLAPGGVDLSAEPARSALLDLAERARAAGATVSFDPNARPPLWGGDYPETLRHALGAVDVVVASGSDLRTGGFAGDPAALAAAVCDRGPHSAVVTLGGDGAVARSTAAAPWGAGTARRPAFPVDDVDPTGAGDAFAAGAIAALGSRVGAAASPLAGIDPEVGTGGDEEGNGALAAALTVGAATGALSTTRVGAIDGAPDRDRLRAFLRERG